MRCGTSGTSGHVTAKSSICNWGVLYKSGVHAVKALCLTPGDLQGVRLGRTEEGVILSDRLAPGIVGARSPKARTVPQEIWGK